MGLVLHPDGDKLLRTSEGLAASQNCCCFADCSECFGALTGLRLIVSGFPSRTCSVTSGTPPQPCTANINLGAANGTYDLTTPDGFQVWKLELGTNVACDGSGILYYTDDCGAPCVPPIPEGGYLWKVAASVFGCNPVNGSVTLSTKGCGCTSSSGPNICGSISPATTVGVRGPWQDFCNGNGITNIGVQNIARFSNCDCSQSANIIFRLKGLFA